MDELTQDCNNSIDIDWPYHHHEAEKNSSRRKRPTRSGHVDLATTIYKFIFSNGNFDK